MNLKNNSFNYAKKYKSICKYLAIALPLLLLLIACIFPTKQINNTYSLQTQTIENTPTSIYFQNIGSNIENQSLSSFNGGNYYIQDYKYYLSTDTLNTTINARVSPINYLVKQNHKYLFTGVDEMPDNFIFYFSSNPQYNAIFNSIFEPNQDYSLHLHVYKNGGYNEIKSFEFYVCLYDLTAMYGYGNEPTFTQFKQTFPLDFYKPEENQQLILQQNIINTYNQETLTQVNETKQPNENILQPLNLLYKADINDWYDTFLTAFDLNYEDNNYMYYLVHYPLYILYVVLLDLLLDIILLVPCLLHRLVHKYKGDD